MTDKIPLVVRPSSLWEKLILINLGSV